MYSTIERIYRNNSAGVKRAQRDREGGGKERGYIHIKGMERRVQWGKWVVKLRLVII